MPDHYKRPSIVERIKNRFTNGGPHLGAVRSWIQWTFIHSNGETVTWGSDERLGNTDLTAGDMDRLAETVKDAVIEDVVAFIEAQEKLAKQAVLEKES